MQRLSANLALAEFQLGKKSLAAGLLRKALSTDPDLAITQAALKFVLSQQQIKEVPHQIETYANIARQAASTCCRCRPI